MPITDLATLKDAALRWAGGSSDEKVADALDDCVRLAEDDLNHGFMLPDGRAVPGLRVPEMVKRVLIEFPGVSIRNLPPDFLELRALGVIEGGIEHPLPALPEDGLAWHMARGPQRPGGFALQGRQLRLAPQPAGTVFARLAYHAAVPPLNGPDADASVLLTYPSAYLYGTLRHLALYLIDPEAAARWGAAFLSVVSGANRAATDRSPGSYGR